MIRSILLGVPTILGIGFAGAAHASTTYDTSKVGCPYSESRLNATTSLTSTASWTCSTTTRTLAANGLPDHSVGEFPNPGNPNTIASQTVSATMPVKPTYLGTATQVKETGYALNGVKFDPGTAQTCTSNCSNNGNDSSGTWRIEALGQTYFDLGVDFNNAHVQPGGTYHYHGMPEGILKQSGFYTSSGKYITSATANTGQTMTLVGWATDGFPIYARYGHAIANYSPSRFVVMNSSYRIKSTLDSGRPSIKIAPAGTFQQDYEYVANLGDLDQCNGRFDVTPEFPNGIYHYYITDTYPYAPRCLMGKVTATMGPPPPPMSTTK